MTLMFIGFHQLDKLRANNGHGVDPCLEKGDYCLLQRP